MAFQDDLFLILAPITAVNTNVSPLKARVFPANFPQGVTYPAIRYTVPSAVPFSDLCDSGDEDTDQIIVTIDSVAAKYDDALALTRAVRAAMSAADPPWLFEDWSGPSYDSETKLYIAQANYSLQGSSS
jgi:hypothetical protein